MGWVEDKIEHVAVAVAVEGERTRQAVAAGLADTLRGLRVDGASTRALRAGVLYGGTRRLLGWAIRETGGTAPVSVDLYDGQDDGAIDDSRLVASFTVPAGGSLVHSITPTGVAFTQGLYAVLSGAGAARGTVLISAAD